MSNPENGTDEPVCRERLRHRSREKKHMDTKGGKAVRGWWWWDELGAWD